MAKFLPVQPISEAPLGCAYCNARRSSRPRAAHSPPPPTHPTPISTRTVNATSEDSQQGWCGCLCGLEKGWLCGSVRQERGGPLGREAERRVPRRRRRHTPLAPSDSSCRLLEIPPPVRTSSTNSARPRSVSGAQPPCSRSVAPPVSRLATTSSPFLASASAPCSVVCRLRASFLLTHAYER